jgi:multiple sugar transport system substrate-binding protein
MTAKKEDVNKVPENPSRRRFLKYGAAAVVVAAVAAGGAYYATRPPTTAPAATSMTSSTMAPPPTTAAQAVTSTASSMSEFALDKGPINVLGIQDPFLYPLQDLVSEFIDSTGIKVNLEAIAYDEVHAKAVNSFITKTPGVDVITVDNLWLGEWANNEWITQLDDVIRRDYTEMNFSDFIPNTIYSLSEWLGHFWTIPVACYSQNVIYRVDVFDKLGLKPPPTNPSDSAWWTWDTYMSYVKQIDNNPAVNSLDLSGKNRMYGTVLCGESPSPITHMYTQLAASQGARWFKHFPDVDPATGAWDFTPQMDSKENAAALKYYCELYKYAPPEAINYVWFDCGTAFGRGNIGMMYWWAPYNYLVDKAGYEVPGDSTVGKNGKPDTTKYNIGLLPSQPGYPQVYSVSAWSFAIDQYSQHKGAAWEFIKWATSAATQKKMGLDNTPGKSPYQFSDFSRASLYSDPDLIAVYPYLPVQLQTYTGWSGINATGKLVRPCMPMYYTLEGLYGPELNKAMGGVETPNVAVANVQSAFKNILGLNGYIPPPAIIPSYNDTLDNCETLMKQLSS